MRDFLKIGRLLRASLALLTVAGGLAIVAPQAHAYDQNTCQPGLRSDVDQFRVDTGGSGDVDFGDDMHVGGVPQGTAVVCWSTGGNSASITGKLFWDSFDAGCAAADVTIVRADGSTASYQGLYEKCSSGGLRSTVVQSSYFGTVNNLDRVRLRLFRKETWQTSYTRVGTWNIEFGD
jgi:hypothetical protein